VRGTRRFPPSCRSCGNLTFFFPFVSSQQCLVLVSSPELHPALFSGPTRIKEGSPLPHFDPPCKGRGFSLFSHAVRIRVLFSLLTASRYVNRKAFRFDRCPILTPTPLLRASTPNSPRPTTKRRKQEARVFPLGFVWPPPSSPPRPSLSYAAFLPRISLPSPMKYVLPSAAYSRRSEKSLFSPLPPEGKPALAYLF